MNSLFHVRLPLSMGNMHLDAGSGGADSEKPVPRHPKSPAQLAQIQAQNRRREYLERHPSYFDNLDHELADVILYERLVRRFQTTAERQGESRAKGYGRVLEADLARGAQRLSNSRPGGGIGEEPWDGEAADREHGRALWRAFLGERFVRGGDIDFDCAAIDADEELDVVAAQDALEQWFDGEEPSWAPVGGDGDVPMIQGETGIQDF